MQSCNLLSSEAPPLRLLFCQLSRAADVAEGGVVSLSRPSACFGPTRRSAPSRGEEMSSPCREQAVTNGGRLQPGLPSTTPSGDSLDQSLRHSILPPVLIRTPHADKGNNYTFRVVYTLPLLFVFSLSLALFLLVQRRAT